MSLPVCGVRLLCLAVLCAAACSRTNPAYFADDAAASGPDSGSADATHPPPADGGVDAAANVDATAPQDAGRPDCSSGVPCHPGGNPCAIGTQACGDPQTCEHPIELSSNEPCGVDMVCKSGACVPPCGTSGIGCPCSSSGATCPETAACDIRACAGGTAGLCVAKPASCLDEWAPVCGCNGTTYRNDCKRLLAGAAFSHYGTCHETNCLNNVDEDNDGLTDCMDPDCTAAGFACAEVPVLGSSTLIGIGNAVAPGDPCPSGLPDVHSLYTESDMVITPDTCGCACGDPTPTGCHVMLTCAAGASCADTGTTTNVSEDCAVYTPPHSAGSKSSCFASEVAAAGTCTETDTRTAGNVSYPSSAETCTAPTGGKCAAASSVCLPQAPVGGTGPCVLLDGETTCPHPYTVRRVFYEDPPFDQRSCIGCACTFKDATCDLTEPSNPSASGVNIYSGDACGGSSLVTPPIPADPEICTTVDFSEVGSAVSSVTLVGYTESGGACAAGTSTSHGSVLPAGPLTVCCLPVGR
jgi:hypothetical protein